MSARTALYRHFDAGGALLYVGISNDALRRLLQHQRRSDRYEQVARVELQWWPARSLARQAEDAAIWNEQPQWNVVRPLREPRPTPVWNERFRSWDLDSRIPL